jgi:hypothetical protein
LKVIAKSFHTEILPLRQQPSLLSFEKMANSMSDRFEMMGALRQDLFRVYGRKVAGSRIFVEFEKEYAQQMTLRLKIPQTSWNCSE